MVPLMLQGLMTCPHASTSRPTCSSCPLCTLQNQRRPKPLDYLPLLDNRNGRCVSGILLRKPAHVPQSLSVFLTINLLSSLTASWIWLIPCPRWIILVMICLYCFAALLSNSMLLHLSSSSLAVGNQTTRGSSFSQSSRIAVFTRRSSPS